MNNFNPNHQPEGILKAWNYFKALGIGNSDFGRSRPRGEITIRSKVDTVYVAHMVRNETYRVTIYSSASTKPERRKLSKEFDKIDDAIKYARIALGL